MTSLAALGPPFSIPVAPTPLPAPVRLIGN